MLFYAYLFYSCSENLYRAISHTDVSMVTLSIVIGFWSDSISISGEMCRRSYKEKSAEYRMRF